jgi:hypothetical protein
MDKSVAEAQRDAIAAALASILGQAGGMVSYLPVGEKNRGFLRDFAGMSSDRLGEASQSLSEAAANEDLGILGEAAVRFPGEAIGVLPELYNPARKAQGAAKAAQGAAKVAQYAPDVLNAAWHAARGYASGGAPQAAVSSGANVLGEKVVEPIVTTPFRPRGVSPDLAGNAAGAGIEMIMNKLLSLYSE